jgi:hypothetical protein
MNRCSGQIANEKKVSEIVANLLMKKEAQKEMRR